MKTIKPIVVILIGAGIAGGIFVYNYGSSLISSYQTQQYLQMAALQDKITELENRPAIEPRIIDNTKTITIHDQAAILSISDIVKQWSPRVAYVYCEWAYANGGAVYASGSGSGFLVSFTNGNYGIVTNKHVVLDEMSYRPTFCKTTFLNGESLDTPWSVNNITWSDDYDIANINNLQDFNSSLKTPSTDYCTDEPNIGDAIVILGYPWIGSNSGITVTEGIISGVEQDYYITSAKIDHGNSGGIAVSIKDNCIIGMPSAAISGSVESLGRILKSSVILNN